MFVYDFIMKCNKNSDFSYTLTVDVDYPEKLKPLLKDLPFLPELIAINKKKQLAINFCNKKRCHIRLLQKILKHGLILKV